MSRYAFIVLSFFLSFGLCHDALADKDPPKKVASTLKKAHRKAAAATEKVVRTVRKQIEEFEQIKGQAKDLEKDINTAKSSVESLSDIPDGFKNFSILNTTIEVPVFVEDVNDVEVTAANLAENYTPQLKSGIAMEVSEQHRVDLKVKAMEDAADLYAKSFVRRQELKKERLEEGSRETTENILEATMDISDSISRRYINILELTRANNEFLANHTLGIVGLEEGYETLDERAAKFEKRNAETAND